MFEDGRGTNFLIAPKTRILVPCEEVGIPGFKCLLLFYLLFFKVYVCDGNTNMSKLVALDFEVFGRVQGVFFRKYTQKRGEELGLRGWCMNTEKGTVVGQLEGEKPKVEEMKRWLQYTGSPQSAIDKAEFRNEKEIPEHSFSDFKIRK